MALSAVTDWILDRKDDGFLCLFHVGVKTSRMWGSHASDAIVIAHRAKLDISPEIVYDYRRLLRATQLECRRITEIVSNIMMSTGLVLSRRGERIVLQPVCVSACV